MHVARHNGLDIRLPCKAGVMRPGDLVKLNQPEWSVWSVDLLKGKWSAIGRMKNSDVAMVIWTTDVDYDYEYGGLGVAMVVANGVQGLIELNYLELVSRARNGPTVRPT